MAIIFITMVTTIAIAVIVASMGFSCLYAALIVLAPPQGSCPRSGLAKLSQGKHFFDLAQS